MYEHVKENYEQDMQRREELAELVDEVIRALPKLELPSQVDVANSLKNTILRDTFKVMVIGEFKTGKSTFINALLGAEVLPSFARPCTAIIAEVHYAEEQRAVLYWSDKTLPPDEIRIEELIERTTIKVDEKEVKNSPYDKVVVHFPLDILKNNVQIIDSPGLNEHEIREKVTLEYLRHADAILFVCSASKLGPSIQEKATIDDLHRAGHTDIFFIINRWDEIKPKQQLEVLEWANNRIKPLSTRDQALYFISSYDALEGRLTQDDAMVNQSGIIPLEQALATFLVTDRAKVKLLRGSRELDNLIAKALETIPTLRGMLETPLAELEERYKVANRKFTELATEVRTILGRVNNFRIDMREAAQGRVRQAYLSANDVVDEWLQPFEVKFSDAFNPNTLAENISNHLSAKLSEYLEAWADETLTPFLDTRMQDLLMELESRTKTFEQKLNRVQFDISGNDTNFVANIFEGNQTSALERTLAAGGGFFLGGAPMAALGAIFGPKAIVEAIIPQIIAIIGALVVGLPLFPVMAIAALLQGGMMGKKMAEGIKQKVGIEFRKKLTDMSHEHANKIAEQIDKHLAEFQDSLERGFNKRINDIRHQVDGIMKEKNEGQQAVNQRKQEVNQAEMILNQVRGQVMAYITALVEK